MFEIKKPLAKAWPITQRFETKVTYMRSGVHSGIDYACPNGTELLACFHGRVIKTENFLINSGYGRAIWVQNLAHPEYVALYAHTSKIFAKVGTDVSVGDIIALSGHSGFSFGVNGGYHLHFAIQKNGEWIDPLPLLQGETIKVPVVETLDKPVEIPDKSGESVMTTYTIKGGDTLFAIAQKFYGSGGKWGRIAQANNITNPRRLLIGKVLIIP